MTTILTISRTVFYIAGASVCLLVMQAMMSPPQTCRTTESVVIRSDAAVKMLQESLKNINATFFDNSPTPRPIHVEKPPEAKRQPMAVPPR